jgi:hypothetical protein
MPEPDIQQHIVAASRGSLNDLGAALGDFHHRLDMIEALSLATVAEIRASAQNVLITPVNATAALDTVVLTDAASVIPDWDAGRNFVLEFEGTRNITNGVNGRYGQSGMIWLNNVAGGNTLTWGNLWRFVGTPTPAQGVAAWSVVFYNFTTGPHINAVMISA